MRSGTILFGLKTLTFFGITALFCSNAQAQIAQTNKARNLIWVTGGGGISSIGGAAGFALSHQFENQIISGRFVRNYTEGGKTQVWDVGALYGRSYKTMQAMISGSGGLAYVGSNTEGSTVGIPLESQIFWTPTRYFGVGVYAFGNLNTKKPFGGALLGIQLGRVTSLVVH